MSLILGVDVGSSFHYAAFLTEKQNISDWKKFPTMKVELSKVGFENLKLAVEDYSQGVRPVKIALEPTGKFYAESFANFCEQQKWAVFWIDNKTLHEYRNPTHPLKTSAMQVHR